MGGWIGNGLDVYGRRTITYNVGWMNIVAGARLGSTTKTSDQKKQSMNGRSVSKGGGGTHQQYQCPG